MNVGPYMAYILYIFVFFILYTKRGFWESKKISSQVSGIFFAILAIKLADFLKLELFLRPFLYTRRHDGSAHTFGSSQSFLEVPQKGFFLAFFIRSTNTQFKHLKYGIVVNWHK